MISMDEIIKDHMKQEGMVWDLKSYNESSEVHEEFKEVAKKRENEQNKIKGKKLNLNKLKDDDSGRQFVI